MTRPTSAALAQERSQLEPVFAYVDQHAEAFVERLRSQGITHMAWVFHHFGGRGAPP